MSPDMLNLFEPVPKYVNTETSKAAAQAIKPTAGTLRAQVLAAIQLAGDDGLTDEEIQDRLDMNPSTERPRRGELAERLLIRKSGQTRKTRAGRKAIVWVASRREANS